MTAPAPRARRGATARLVGGLLLAAFAGGCESSVPEIRDLAWLLVDFDDRALGVRYESLAVFVHAADADGLEDVEELYLLHDAAELLWSLDADNWVREEDTSAGTVRIGSPVISMPGRAAFPAGDYRVLVVDVGGERAERSFRLPAQRSASPRPQVRIEDDVLHVGGARAGDSSHVVWVVSDDVFVQSVEVDGSGAVELRELVRGRAGSYELYVLGHAEGALKGALTGPYAWQL